MLAKNCTIFFCPDSDDFLMEAQMYYMYSYGQLLATLNQQNAIIHSKLNKLQ